MAIFIFSYGVFALGNSSYPSFCGFGTWLDSAFSELSGQRLLKIGYGDELGDRDTEFEEWSKMAYQQACLECSLDTKFDGSQKLDETGLLSTKWILMPKDPIKDAGQSNSEIVREGNNYTRIFCSKIKKCSLVFYSSDLFYSKQTDLLYMAPIPLCR